MNKKSPGAVVKRKIATQRKKHTDHHITLFFAPLRYFIKAKK